MDNITLRVSSSLLFEGTTWALESGRHWTVFGPNGSGKSMLASALCRKIPLIKGRIHFYFDGPECQPRAYLKPGEIVRISAEAHRSLMRRYAGYHQARWHSFEDENSPTVEDFLHGQTPENRFLVRESEFAPPKNNQETWYDTINLFGIDRLLGRKLIHISNGEARKALIAKAMIQTPRLLILDDPFTGLDTASRDTLRQALDRMLAMGKTQVVLLTSREDEILDNMTDLLCVEKGRVVFQGPKKEMMERARNRLSCVSVKTCEQKAVFGFPASAMDPATGFATIVDMKNVSIAYHGTTVLDGLNWRMKPGERWALLGHNGAGKSTLLSLVLADNPQAYANDISLFDQKRGSGESIWDIKRRIGHVSPESQIYHGPDITCLQAVCSGFFDTVGLYRACQPKQEETARQWLASLGMESLADRSFLSLSTGEKRMTMLARALVKAPVLLALDEPCQGLDAKHRKQIIGILDRLCEQTSLSLIFVSHHVDEMPKSITHVLRLENGKAVDCRKRNANDP